VTDCTGDAPAHGWGWNPGETTGACNQSGDRGVREMTHGERFVTSKVHEEFLAATLPSLDLVYNLARRMAAERDEVEDLVQETYLRAFEAWVRRRRPRKVEPWMATICLNAGRSRLRRAWNREIPTDSEPLLPDPASVEDDVMREIRRSAVHDALSRLPPDQRMAIALMDLSGFTAAEVARITGAPRGTVLARVHRGRKKLAQLLEGSVLFREEA
jgi:RNA polymerase sigma-70 factor (ECF subfamily)